MKKFYELSTENRYSHGCADYAQYADNGDGTATCVTAISCHNCWQVGHDDDNIYDVVGRTRPINDLIEAPDFIGVIDEMGEEVSISVS